MDAGKVAAISLAAVLSVCGGWADAFAGEKSPRSYLELPLDASGIPRAVPYVWERQARGKQLVVIGTRHLRDPDSPMFSRIEDIFDRVRPELVLHESTAPEALRAMPKEQAIKIGADLGFAVYLAGRHGAATRSGDASPEEEIRALLARYPAQQVLVFLTAQRLIGGGRNPDLRAAAAEYPAFFEDYLFRNGLPRQPGWGTWDGFVREYENVVGRRLTKDSWDPESTSPLHKDGVLSELSRAINAVRDRHLLAAIRKALREHDRVVVVFGNWHVLALEPVLDDVLKH